MRELEKQISQAQARERVRAGYSRTGIFDYLIGVLYIGQMHSVCASCFKSAGVVRPGAVPEADYIALQERERRAQNELLALSAQNMELRFRAERAELLERRLRAYASASGTSTSMSSS